MCILYIITLLGTYNNSVQNTSVGGDIKDAFFGEDIKYASIGGPSNSVII